MKKTLLPAVMILVALWCGAQSSTYQFNGEQGVFTENMGQVVDEQGQPLPDVLAKASMTGLDIYITKMGATYVLQKYEEDFNAKPHPVYINEKKYKIKYSRVDVALTGAKLGHGQMVWADDAGWKSNYYKTADGKGQLAVEHFKTLTIQNVYPGIDWVWKFNAKNKPEYDFVVHPGADVSVIKMKYSYADLLPAKNKLTISTRIGSLTEGPLQASSNNAKTEVSYVVDAKLKEVGFAAAGYDKSKDLLIDPPLALDWSAQFGGAFLNGLRGVTTDTSGGVYMAGYTTSPNFPTQGPGLGGYIDSTFNGQSDVVLLKLDTLQNLKWATFMGGAGNDFANSICFRPTTGFRSIFVTGGAQSGFPIQGGDTTCTGQDVFMAAFNSNLTLQYSSFYGGNGTDEGLKIYCTHANACCPNTAQLCYIVGYTNSTNNTFATYAFYYYNYQQTSVTGQEAFIMAFNPNNAPMQLLWSTKYGGSGDDYATSVTGDSLGNTVVTGFTSSTNIPLAPVSNGYYQGTNAGGTDGFIIKFSPTYGLASATYYGGSGNDYFTDVTTGINGNFLFTGRTNSPNFPLFNSEGFGYNQTQLGDASGDAFIAKCDNAMEMKWATYYGGNGTDAGTGIATDKAGQMYVTGFTFSNNFPVDSFSGAFFQPTNHGNSDGFIARFTDLGIRNWSTYKGDSCYQYPYDIAYDKVYNKFYVAGEGLLACGPPNADSGGQSLPDTGQVHGGVSSVGFCWAFNGQNNVPPACTGFGLSANQTVQPCPGLCNGVATAIVVGGQAPYSYAWSSGGSLATDSNLCPFESWVEVKDNAGCKAEANLYWAPPLQVTLSTVDIICNPGPGAVTAYTNYGNGPNYLYQWSTSPGIFSDSTMISVTSVGTYSVTAEDNTGCTVSASANVGYNNQCPFSQIDVLQYPGCSNNNTGIVTLNIFNTNNFYPNGNVVWEDINYNVIATGYTFNNAGLEPYYAVDSAYCYNGVTSPVYYYFWLQSSPSIAQLFATPPSMCTTFDGYGSVGFATQYSQATSANPYCGTIDNTISVTNYTNATYLWSDGSYNQTDYNLSGSQYYVTVTDGYCQTVLSATFALPTPGITAYVDTPACGPASVDLNSTGVDGPYTFAWNNGITSNALANVTPGTYTVTVTGVNQCTVSDTFNIAATGSGITVSLSSAGITCAPGTVTATANGGTGPYQYEWSTSPGSFGDSVSIFVGVAGTYAVTVSDGNGCNGRDSVEVGYNNLPIVIDTIVIIQYPSCGLSNGIVCIRPNNPGTITWTLPDFSTEHSDTIFNAPDEGAFGDFSSIEITDNSNCYNGQPEQVEYSLFMQGTINNGPIQYLQQPTGCNTNDGSLIMAMGTPGYGAVSGYVNGHEVSPSYIILDLPPITFHWSNGFTVTNTYSTFLNGGYNKSEIDNVDPGTYTVTITGGTCAFVDTVILTPVNSPLMAHYEITSANCASNNNGSIQLLSLQNSIGTNTYAWSNGATTSSITNLSAGTYRVTITGPNACPVIDTFVVVTSNTGLPVTLSSAGITCAPGTVTATPNGGTGPYQFEWSTSPGSFGDSGSIFIGLAGTYAVTVLDGSGCSGKDSVEVGYNNLPIAYYNFVIEQYPSCGLSNGIVYFTDPDPSKVTWTWPNYLRITHGDTLTGVFTSDQNVYVVTDSSNCLNGQPMPVIYWLQVPDAFNNWNWFESNLSALSPPTGCNTQDGVVEITIDNWPTAIRPDSGTYSAITINNYSPIEYQWSNGNSYTINSNNYSNSYYQNIEHGFNPGLYSVTITDGSCTLKDSISLHSSDPPLIANYSVNNGLCSDTSQGSLHLVNLQNNLPNIYGDTIDSFAWSNGATTPSITNLSIGTYTVTITGANACPVIDTLHISQPVGPLVSDSVGQVLCNGGNASVTLQATGGTPPYTGTGTFIEPMGDYTLFVTDDHGCKDSVHIAITGQPTPLEINITVQDTAARCRDTLSALVSASGGTPPYTGPTAVVYTQNGNYTITVTDHNGCRADSVLAVHLDTCTGIETLTAGTGVLVYPNPAANKFYVKFELPVTTETNLKLYAADGKLVLLKSLTTGADLSELDCSMLASGVYILNTYTGGRQFYFKVVIER